MDIRTMLAEEAAKCREWLKDAQKPLRTPLRITIEQFVERVFLLHRNLIEKWSGWVWHGKPMDGNTMLMEEHRRQLANEEWKLLGRNLGELYRKGEISARDASSDLYFYTDVGYTIGPDFLLSSRDLKEEYNLPDVGKVRTTKSEQTYGRSPFLNVGKASPGINRITTVRPGQSLSRAVLRAFEDYPPDHPKKVLPEWEKLFQRLGEIVWSTKDVQVAISLTCAPSGFLSLGHYGENSCYQNGGQSEFSKLFLGADFPDSFVMLTYFDREDGRRFKVTKSDRRIGAPDGRSWGFATPHGYIITNFYKTPFKTISQVVTKSIERALYKDKKLVSTPDNESLVQVYLRARSGIYTNNDQQLFVVDGERARFVEYCRAVMGETGLYGVYTNSGKGPLIYRGLDGSYGLEKMDPATKVLVDKNWPYQDAYPHVLMDRMMLDGTKAQPVEGGRPVEFQHMAAQVAVPWAHVAPIAPFHNINPDMARLQQNAARPAVINPHNLEPAQPIRPLVVPLGWHEDDDAIGEEHP